MSTETSRDAPQPGGDEHTTYSDLAEVNLLRMRGRYDEAIQKCTALLRQRPNDAVLHSLIGDICRDQGNLDEAVQWYRMALDLDPNSAYDREKLDRLEHLTLASQSQRSALDWWRWAILACAAAVLAVAVGTGWAIWSSRTTPPARVEPAPTNQASPPGLAVPSPQRPQAQTAQPQVPPASQYPATAGAVKPIAENEETGSSTALERHLLDLLSKSIQPEVSGRTSVQSITIDPRSHTAVVSIYFTSPPAKPQELETLLADARAVAVWTLSLAPDLRSVTIRVLSRFAQRLGVVGPAELIFIGDLQRDRADIAAAPNANPFTAQWWSPRVTAAVPQGTGELR